jgi:DNA-binding phage protein
MQSPVFVALFGLLDFSLHLLRDLVNVTVGFEELAIETSKLSKSLHRMLSAKGNPTMDNLTVILNVLRKKLQVDI